MPSAGEQTEPTIHSVGGAFCGACSQAREPVGKHHATSSSTNYALCSGCCHFAHRVVRRNCRGLSQSADHLGGSFPAGGPVDTLARIVTEPISRVLGQPIVIENVSGAAGSIGVGRVARAPPDGYTLIQGIWSTHVLNGAVYRLSYDVLNDFAPIAP